MDTIFALSSGSPPAGIAVVRVSGPDAQHAALALAGSLPEPRRAALRTLSGPDGGELDRAVILWFDGPNTATGHDIVEFHLHGGRAVVAAVERALSVVPGLRAAEAGEFTRQALISGRIDLTEAEGLGDLLEAETETARRAALQTSGGSVRRLTEDWTSTVLGIAAQVEAMLDHADEDDVAVAASEDIARQCEAIASQMTEALDQPSVERLKDGIHVVLAGPPNAGKSTLLNRVVDREVAIVSPIAGTTRDRIEASIQRNGIAYVFSDTAGLAIETDDPIEAIGIARAREAAASADIVLWLDDQPAPDELREKTIEIRARCDEPGRRGGKDRLPVSGATGEGVAELWTRIEQRASELVPRLDGALLNRRQRELLGRARDALRDVGEVGDLLIAAENIRMARGALDRITGRADVEAVLDGIFSRFCIGK